MNFNASEIAATFVPRNRTEPQPEKYLARLAVCQRCPLRFAHTCRPASQLCSVLARLPAGRCPVGRWPDNPPPPARPAPLWRHGDKRGDPLAGLTLGPVPAAIPLESTWPILLPPHTIRNLCCHVYPLTAGQKWRRTAEHLCARKELWNGVKAIAVSRGPGCDTLDDVRAAFEPLGAGDGELLVFEVDNHPDLGEVTGFLPLLETVFGDGDGVHSCAGQLTFYCHSKGATWPETSHPAHEWADTMFAAALNEFDLVCELLSTASVCGSFRRVLRLPNTGSYWHYSGTFFWFRNDAIFDARDGDLWHNVEQVWSGTEAWPALQVAPEHAACLFLDNAGDLYDPAYWDAVVRPAWRAWREKRG